MDLFKVLGAALVFAIGLFQYRRAQKWKRREFIAAQIKEFESDKDIQIMMAILDWNNRTFRFTSETGQVREVKVDDQLLCGALLPHEIAGGYSHDEVSVRGSVDRFLDMLVRLENFVDAGLINVNELRPYMDYWIKLTSGQMPGRHCPEVFALLLNYIRHYDFQGAARLIEEFRYSTVPPTDVDQAIQKTLAERKRHEFQVSMDSASLPSA